MDSQQVFTAGQQGLYMLLMVSAPILLAVLVVGLAVSIFQAERAMTIPPATRSTGIEIPNTLSTYAPMSMETTRVTKL